MNSDFLPSTDHSESSTEVKSERRGGARAGAGRKPKTDRTQRLGLNISELAKANLTSYASERGISMAEALNRILESLGK